MRALDKQKYRKCDKFGCGFYGASRGTRKHKGIDLISIDGEKVYSPIDGKVTKLGYCYADDLSFRYVEISNKKHVVRLLYVQPSIPINAELCAGDTIGSAQSLQNRYQGITPHIHAEVKEFGDEINPETLFKED